MIREALRKNNQRVQVAHTASIPAPTLGWNAVDPLANMKPGYAVILDNWIPRPGYVELRRGSRLWCSAAPAPVETVMVYRGNPTGGDEIYGVSDGDVYDCTTMDTTFTGAVYTGLTNSRVQWLNFANSGGAFLMCFNGADTPFHYDGAAWTTLTITGSSGPITLDPVDLIDLVLFKRRLFLVEKDSLHVWYLAVDAIQGAANLLDLGPIFQEGGTIAEIGTWSLDGGQGQDDYLAIVSTQGECAIYQGTDPDDPLYWSIVGTFHIGQPMGRRSLLQFGSDLLILTQTGVMSMSQALKLDRSQFNNVAITQKIQNAFQVATAAYKNNFGWQAITYDIGSLAIYNVPTDELVTSQQFVQNVQTGAWCRFTGLNAFCWATTDDYIFYGGTDGLYQWDVGVTDAGTDLTADLETAFNVFNEPGRLKHFTMLQPVLNATANMAPAIEVVTDFEERTPTAVPVTISDRSTTLSIRKDWTSAVGVGVWGAVRMQVILAEDPLLAATLVDGAGNDVVDGAGNTIAVDTGEPASAIVQCIGFNIVMQDGGVL